MDHYEMRPVARLRGDFPSKFGVPRQSGLAKSIVSRVVFEKEFRDVNALRGIEQFSHLWLIWVFSENIGAPLSPTVRPPRLGGNTRLGVFATRSPFRPNPIGLSCVRLLRVEHDPKDGAVLVVEGADLMDGTPILDIKPYLPHSEAYPEAAGGYTDSTIRYSLRVEAGEELLRRLPEEKREALLEALSRDPRPSYQNDPERIYFMPYAGREIRFRVSGDTLTVTDIV